MRTGDTAADERRKLSTKPPDILITTPESLFLILTSKARDSLRGVDTVIVDEVRALAGNKRGAHLTVSLEQLDALRGSVDAPDKAAAPGAPRPAQRIGLSATVRPAEEVAAFLGGSAPVTIAAPPHEESVELRIVVPVEDMADPDPAAGVPAAGRGHHGRRGPTRCRRGTAGRGPPGPALDLAARRGAHPRPDRGTHRSTIVFANSRRGLAERLCGRLNDLAADRALAREEASALARHAASRPAGQGPRPRSWRESAAASGAARSRWPSAHHGSSLPGLNGPRSRRRSRRAEAA